MPTPQDLAEKLQYGALVFEISGLALAFIEVRFPSLANRLGEYLRKDFARAEEALWAIAERFSSQNELLLRAIYLAIAAILFGGMFWFAWITFTNGEYLYTIGALFGVYSTICWAALKWIPERPIGSLGVMIAFTGVLCEIWQMSLQSSGA